ncbi:hypothetical protein LXL04_003327 [Taraxacum kok-saghyz]
MPMCLGEATPCSLRAMYPPNLPFYSRYVFSSIVARKTKWANVGVLRKALKRVLCANVGFQKFYKYNWILLKLMAFQVGQEEEVCAGEAFSTGRILALYKNGALVEYDKSFVQHGFPHIELVFYYAYNSPDVGWTYASLPTDTTPERALGSHSLADASHRNKEGNPG